MQIFNKIQSFTMKQIKRIETRITEIDGESYLAEQIEYDKAGNIIQSIKYDPDEAVIEKTENFYDDQGKKIREKNYLSEDELAEDHHFTYDESGRLKEEHVSYAEGYEALRRFNFDRDNQIMRIDELDENDEIEEYIIRTFNDKNKLTEQAEYDERDKLKTAKRYHYDENNNLVKQEEFEKSFKKPFTTREYTYTEDGELASLTVKNRKGKIIDYYKLRYDKEGRVLQQQSAQSGNISITYNGKNNRKETITDPAGNIKKETEYYYDEEGNLIRESDQMTRKDFEIQYFD